MHRIVTVSDTGEQRTIEYASRAAAFRHFGAIALARHTHRASIERRIMPDGDLNEPHAEVWVEVAQMNIAQAGHA